jgi:segregation and condensation protein B
VEKDLKNEVEAVLFSAGKKIELAEIAKICRCRDFDIVKKELKKLQQDYDKKNNPLMVVEDGTAWKLTVRERYLPLVRKIVADTELAKTVMETLAVIAWKYPILQSEVIKIRTNKAYDHIAELDKMGFLTKEKEGRTFRIKLSQKFFDYFDLHDRKDIQKVFRNVKDQPKEPPLKDAEKLGKLQVFEEEKPSEGKKPSVGNLEVYEGAGKEQEAAKKPLEKQTEEDIDDVEENDKPESTKDDSDEPLERKEESEDEPEIIEKTEESEDNERELDPELEEMVHKEQKKKKFEDDDEDTSA